MSRGRRRAPLRRDPSTPDRRRGDPPRFRIGQPADLLAVIPFLLGFHPTESLVVALVRSGRILVTARLDLPPASAAPELARQWMALADRHQAAEFVLVAYSDRGAEARALLEALAAALAGRRLTEVLLLSEGRFYSVGCTSGCCPAQGTPFDHASHPLAAAGVYAGLGVRASRTELQICVEGPAAGDRARLSGLSEAVTREREALGHRTVAGRRLTDLLAAAEADPDVLDDGAALWLAVLITDIGLRDLAWAAITHDNAERHARIWQAVVARAADDLAAAPLCLLGMASWIAGDGAMLNVCCERLAQIAPDYSMAGLLEQISAQALPPSVWRELSAQIQAELRVRFDLLAG